MMPAPTSVSFDLIDHDGHRFTECDLPPHPSIVYFGFLHCRVVCPRSLAKISEVFTCLGSRAQSLRALYISVDPKRDTPEALKAFLASRYPMIIGATGTTAQIEHAKAEFRVFSRQKSTDGSSDYDVPHTAFIYLLDKKARLIRHFPDTHTAEQIALEIEKCGVFRD